jgi:ribosomal protein S18 acetylase RimI-like enzyme
MSEMIIRSFTVIDTSPVQSLLCQLQHHEMTLHPNRLPWNYIRETYWEWLTATVEENEGFIYVAEKEAKVAGVIIGWVDEVEAIAEDPAEWRHGFIQDVVVSAEFRGQGIGRALVKAAEEYFVFSGVTVVRVCALANNEAAHQLYKTLDMKPYEITYEKKLPVPVKMVRRA